MVVKIMVPFWGTLNIRGRIIIGIQKGTIIFTTTHIIDTGEGIFPGVGMIWGILGMFGACRLARSTFEHVCIWIFYWPESL